MGVTVEDIEKYLSEVKEAVRNNRYRIDRNQNRQANIDLFLDYVINENDAKGILLSLTAMDFSEILHNEHKGFEQERLYVFGKDVRLLERTGDTEKTVSLYIKFNKLGSCYVVVISFHEQRFPLSYCFK
ncbi:MAG: type II toxin-antitoxin system MqsR family toxin [Lachnospiraceae bacterium]|nr:type II toxin-antitoxin system MqsR family toxin [Lachnospiraceae bacterium]